MKNIFLTFIFCLTFLISDSEANFAMYQDGIVINLAGRQRMLTQKMSKEALLIAKNIHTQENIKNLRDSIALFDKTLNGLIYGNKDLNLKKTTDKEILEQLEIVKKIWDKFKVSVTKVANQNFDKSTLEDIDRGNLELLNNMNIAVEMYENLKAQHIDPQIARTINLAGKERMLTQKMTKELLLVANSLKSDENEKSLKSTGELFKETLTDLITNNKKAMQNPEIAKRLLNVQNLWNEYQNIIANTGFSEKDKRASKLKEEKISKKITKELLIIANLVDAQVYRDNLKKTGELFDRILTGLIEGDANLGLKGTNNPKILVQLEKVKKLWAEYKTIIENVDISPEALKKAMDINIPLLNSMNRAVSMYEKSLK